MLYFYQNHAPVVACGGHMTEQKAPDGKSKKEGTEIHVARIGLISAVIVAACGLFGTLITVFGPAVRDFLSPRNEPTAEATQALGAPATTLLGPSADASVSTTLGDNIFLVENKLLLPVRLFVDDSLLDELPAGTSRTYPISQSSLRLDWELVKETTSGGRAIGDDMAGGFGGVEAGDVLDINNVVDDQDYFYPYVTNHLSEECEVIVNSGWENENVTGAVVPANSQEVSLGYYRLYTNSNLTLDCGGTTYWWGLQPDENSDTSFYGDVEEDTGWIEFILDE
jgi:hypothetical protein